MSSPYPPKIINILGLNGGLRTTFYDFSVNIVPPADISYKYQVDSNAAMSFTPILENNDQNKSVIISGLTNGVSYSIKIISITGGSSYTSTAKIGVPYDFPTSTLNATVVSGTAIDFTYNKQNDNGMAITDTQYSFNGGAYSAVSVNPYTYNATGLTTGVQYSFDVSMNLTDENVELRNGNFNEMTIGSNTFTNITTAYFQTNYFYGWKFYYYYFHLNNGSTQLITDGITYPTSLVIQANKVNASLINDGIITQSKYLTKSNYTISAAYMYSKNSQNVSDPSLYKFKFEIGDSSSNWFSNDRKDIWNTFNYTFPIFVDNLYDINIRFFNTDTTNNMVLLTNINLKKLNTNIISVSGMPDDVPAQISYVSGTTNMYDTIQIRFTPPITSATAPITAYKYKINEYEYNTIHPPYDIRQDGYMYFYLRAGLIPSTQYTIQIVTTNRVGNSLASNPVNISYLASPQSTNIHIIGTDIIVDNIHNSTLREFSFNGSTVSFSPNTTSLASTSRNPAFSQLYTTINPAFSPTLTNSTFDETLSQITFSQPGYNAATPYTLNYSSDETTWKQITNVKNPV